MGFHQVTVDKAKPATDDFLAIRSRAPKSLMLRVMNGRAET
jgi:hypothetical protein